MALRHHLLNTFGLLLATWVGALASTQAAPESTVRGGLPNVYAKASAGEQVRVAFLGGSITAAEGWRVHTLANLRDAFGAATFTEIFAAVPGSGSNYGAARLERDVLQHRPDLLFVEFAANDGTGSPRVEAQMEGIVRQTWAANPSTDICFVYTITEALLPAFQAGEYPSVVRSMEKVAAHYGIPSIALGVEVARGVAAGTLLFTAPVSVAVDAQGRDSTGRLVFTNDKTHPTAAGHRLYAECLAQALPAFWRAGPAGPHTLPAPLAADHWQRARLIPVADVTRGGGWRALAASDPVAKEAGRLAPPIWSTFEPGAAAEFRFTGTAFGLVGLKGPDNGEFRVTIDDQPPETGTLFDSYSTPGRHLLRAWFYSKPLADTEHSVRIELLATKIDKAAIMQHAGTPIIDPSPYEGHGLYLCGLLAVGEPLAAGADVALADAACRIAWEQAPDGWRLRSAVVHTPGGDIPVGLPSGAYTMLYSPEKPSTEAPPVSWAGHDGEAFPEKIYRYTTPMWREATTPVALNTAGEMHQFFPTHCERGADGALVFSHETDVAALRAVWRPDPAFAGDVQVTLTLTARRAGFFSIATPSLATLAPADLAWAMVPGYFQGAAFNSDLVLALAYGHGLPDRPVVVRERAASTLAPLMTSRSGATLAVVPEPGTATDPWTRERDTRPLWRLGLSHLNRAGELSPTLYHPVLGEDGSRLEAGDTRTFCFRYVLRSGDWFAAVKHAAGDIYRLGDFLALKQPQRSLSERLLALHGYVTDDRTSLWRTEAFGGLEIGAQAYLGGVVGSDKDAMKNSDYGAMWMLARLTEDPRLTRDRLPFARNFKLVQQQREPGFFQGAAVGQYYLSKSRRFTEEWGDYVEPVALTYYVLLDLGNILLFTPDDGELRERLRLAADRLLAWQQPAGYWDVAYDHATQRPPFAELPDLRPTFYGLLVAYRLLGDEKYLTAARRGADWLITNAVDRGRFLGVCGDSRFAPDFATAQIAEALLALHELTGERRYRDAAVAAARFYTTSIYTHPVATAEVKRVGDADRADWEISQTGLSFEHGGAIGSANRHGPILLASHAGLFLRMHALTGEPLFRDLARAAAWGRDAFVDPATSVASYYWNAMNKGAGPYPHHAWWQIGWITDYLIAEAGLRSGGAIAFPRGFMTPKVGPHASYGFAPGKIFGASASLGWGDVKTGDAAIDYLVARDDSVRRRWIILLNNRLQPGRATVAAVPEALGADAGSSWKKASLVTANGDRRPLDLEERWTVDLAAAGLAVIELEY